MGKEWITISQRRNSVSQQMPNFINEDRNAGKKKCGITSPQLEDCYQKENKRQIGKRKCLIHSSWQCELGQDHENSNEVP